MTVSAIARATEEPATSLACMFPSTHTAGRITSGSAPTISIHSSRPSRLWPIERSETNAGKAVAQARSWAVIAAWSR
jgi:hypothetical protein